MIAFAVLVLGFGVVQLDSMPVDVLPEFGTTKVEIRTEALGLSAYEVEQLITAPMEQNLLNGVAFLDDIASKSVPGLSSVVLTFQDGTDPFDARQVVQERLTTASKLLPNVSKPPAMLQPLSATSRVMMIGLRSSDVSLLDMSVLARWNIRPRLMGVAGVSNVAIWGQRDEQLQVLVDPERLRLEGLNLDQIISTAGNALWVSPLSFLKAAAPGRGGFVDTPAQRLGVQHINPIVTPEDLARVAIETTPATNGAARAPAKQLGDIATVVRGHQPLIGDGLIADEAGLMLVIQKLPNANALEVTRGVEAELARLAPGLDGIEIESSVFRPATYIETSRDNLQGLLLIGLGLGILVLAALTFSWRAVLVSVVAAAVSLAATLVVLAQMGESLNVMIIAGLVLAITVLVDDGVSDRDSISRSLGERRAEGADPDTQPILSGSSAVRGPLGYATAIALLTLVPLFVLTGESDAFLATIGRSFAVAIVMSLIVAMTVTPALSRVVGPSAGQSARTSPIAVGVTKACTGIVSKITTTPIVAYLATAAILAVGLGSMAFLERPASLVPRFQDSDLLVRWEGPTGTSLTEMNRISARVGAELRKLPGINNVGAHTGRAVLSDDIGGANAGELWVNIDSTANYAATVGTVKEVIHGYPGISRGVTEYSTDRIGDVLERAEGDITVRVFGQEQGVLQDKAAEIARGLTAIDGVTSTSVEQLDIEPTVEVNVDLNKAELAGIKAGDVRRISATYIQGIEVGSLFVDQKVFDVIVQGVPEVRQNLGDIENLPIDTPNAGLVRLADLATVKIAPNPSVIKHESVTRSLDVHATLDGDADGTVGKIKDTIAGVSFPLEHHAEILGDRADRNSAREGFIFFVIGVALAAFLLLQAAFNSWRLAAVVFVTLPTAVAGGALAALLNGGTVTIGSVVGFLAVLGIALRFTVLLVRRYQHPDPDALTDEPEPVSLRLVIDATRERVLPILTTVAVGAAILVPIVVAGPEAGTEIIHPMAVVLIGGLITAALYALFIVPVLYLQHAPVPSRSRRAGVPGGGGGSRSRRALRHERRNRGGSQPSGNEEIR